MPGIVGAVDRLTLAAQHGLVDQAGHRLVRDLVQDAVEVGRPQARAGGQGDAQGAQELAQAFDLGGVGVVMDAVQAGGVALLERLGGRDVGQHHELLDQLVAVEPFAHADFGDAAVLAQGDLALGQVEVEGAALLACPQQNLEGAVERRMTGPSGRDLGVGCILGALDAGVGERRRGRADHGRGEAVAVRCPSHRSTFLPPKPSGLAADQRAPVGLASASGSMGTTRSGK